MGISRRNLIATTVLAGAGAIACGWGEHSTWAKPAYVKEVDMGLQSLRNLAQQNLTLCQELLAVLRTNDLEKAKLAYMNARPPYEQIEVHAGSYEQTDRDIDARPYAFERGEDDPEFRGFHKIEALIFRDGNLRSAIPFAERLIVSSQQLIKDLQKRQNFSASKHFDGMIALANEVGAKKISSEEETWSDQSILIFRENWQGIYSQYRPFVPAIAKTNAKISELVESAYTSAMATIASFTFPNQAMTAPYSQVSMRDRQKIVRATNRLRDALKKARAVLRV
jgi:iron uptake system component EfeO